jgi:hypothetical protein
MRQPNRKPRKDTLAREHAKPNSKSTQETPDQDTDRLKQREQASKGLNETLSERR